MKVKELKKFIEQADDDLEVVISPLVVIPKKKLGIQPEKPEEEFTEVNHPDIKLPLVRVGEYTSLYGDDDGTRYLFLAFREDDIITEGKTEDFVN